MTCILSPEIFDGPFIDETPDDRLVWLCLLIAADENCEIVGTPKELAKKFRLSVEQVKRAIARFEDFTEESEWRCQLERLSDKFGWKLSSVSGVGWWLWR